MAARVESEATGWEPTACPTLSGTTALPASVLAL